MAVDPTARVADGARIGDGVEIGPYCIVGPQVELCAGVRLIAQVNVTGVTTVGEGTMVHPFASLGSPPQSVHYRGGATRLVIGQHCQLREAVTMNTGTEDGGGITRVGDRCMFMAGSHVGHDCTVGNDVTLANNAALGGHVSISDHVFVGGQSAVHQYVRVGEGVMVAGVCGVANDVIPFGFAIGSHAYLDGLNVVGLRRRGVANADRLRLRRAYRTLFFGEGPFSERVGAVAAEFADDPLVGKVVAFVGTSGKRALMRPRLRPQSGDPGDVAE